MRTNDLANILPFSAMTGRQIEDLSDYLRRKLSEDDSLTLNKIEERSKRGGKAGITHSYLSKILNRAVSNPSIAKLEAIADGLGVLKEEVFAIASGKASYGELTFDELRLLEHFRRLPAERQSDAAAYVEMLYQRYGQMETESTAVGMQPVFSAIAGVPKSVKGKKQKKKRSTE